MAEHERCIECDNPTGRAGRGDDSLYIGDFGPYCEECFDLVPEVFAVEAANQKVIARRLREQVTVLTEALEPFGEQARHHVADAPEWDDGSSVSLVVNIRDLRAVLTALSKARGDT